MIKIERTYNITLLDSNVVNYTITSNKSCITIDNASGSFNGTTKKIYVTYHVKDLDCFTGNTITIIVTNDKGCTNTFTDTLVNECNNLNVDIEQPDLDNLLFNAIVTGGKPPYLYNWIYGLDAQFDSNEPIKNGYHTQNTVSIRWIGTTLQPGYKEPQAIRVRVKDANGCITEGVIYYKLACEPVIASETVIAKCFPLNSGDVRRFDLSLINLGCGDLINNELDINYAEAKQINKGDNKYEITIPEFNTSSVILPIKVRNNKNILSDTFNIIVTKSGNCKVKPDCDAGFILNSYTSDTKTITFDNSLASIKDNVDFATDYIDYDTFTFIAGNGQVLTNATTLTITGKGVATFDAITGEITYTKTTPTVEVIPVKWKIKNDCEVFSQIFKLNINSVLSIAPAVTNLTKNVFIGDTSTTTVTSNNNTTIASLKIITNPTVGTLTVNEDDVTYSPINYSSTNQTVTLQPVNQYGKSGTNFTITYTILSSGIAKPFNTCNSVTSYNLFDLLISNSYTTGGTWTTTSGINIINNQVTISNSGIYNFIYTVSVGGLTKTTTTAINYINATISSIDVTNQSASSRVIKITPLGFTSTQLNSISYVTVNVITATKQLTLSQNPVTINNNILFTTIDITDTDGIILSDYNRIEVIIPQELSPCNNSILGTYIKSSTILESLLTASVTINNSKLFNCDGTYNYTYDNNLGIYNGYKVTAAIPPVNPYGVEDASYSDFGKYGTRIYPVNGWDSKGDLKPIYIYDYIMTTNYWKKTLLSQGPVNRHAIWADDGINGTDLPEDKWIGFSKCINVSVGKIYYVGLAGDNYFRLKLNSNDIINTKQPGGSLYGSQDAFFYWHVYPVYIPAGKNTLELTAWNDNIQGALACVIYDNTAIQLVNADDNNDLNIIFNSKTVNSIDIIQTDNGTYESRGYTCPSGYNTYSPCDGNNCYQYIQCGTPII